MALRCLQLAFDNQWLKKAIFHETAQEAPKGAALAESFKETLDATDGTQKKLLEENKQAVAEITDKLVSNKKFGENPAQALASLQQLINGLDEIESKLEGKTITQAEYDELRADLLKNFDSETLPAFEAMKRALQQVDDRLALMETHKKQLAVLDAQKADAAEIAHAQAAFAEPAEEDLTAGISTVTGRPMPAAGKDSMPAHALGYRPQEDERKDVPPDRSTATPAPLDAPLTSTSPEPVPESTPYDALLGKAVKLPPDFRAEDSWEEIGNMKYRKNGDAIIAAIQVFTDLCTAQGKEMDRRHMWKALKSDDLSVSFDKMARAVFKKNGKNVFTDYRKCAVDDPKKAAYEKFFVAAQQLMDLLPQAEPTGVNAETQRALEAQNVPTNMQEVAAFTDEYLFDRESYGPPIRLDVFQTLLFALKGKDRPTISEDNWLDEVALNRREGEAQNYGEIEVISQHAAYKKLLDSKTPEEYLEKTNHYLNLGKEVINDLAGMDQMKGLKLGFKPNDATEFTLEQIKDPNFKPSHDQVEAIHHGMMIEAAQELRIKQDAEKKAVAEANGDIFLAASAGAYTILPSDEGVNAGTGLDGSLGVGVKTGENSNVSLELRGSKDLTNDSGSVGAAVGYHTKAETNGGKGYIGADVTLGVNTDGTTPSVGIDGRGYAGAYLDKNKTVAIEAGGSGYLGTNGAYAGMDLGVKRNLDNTFEARYERFKEKNAVQIKELKEAMAAAIDGTSLSEPEKTARKEAIDAYVDLLIQKCVLRKFTEFPIKWVGARIRAGVGADLKDMKFGIVLDASGQFALIRPTTHMRPGDSSSATVEGGTASIEENWKTVDKDEQTLDLPTDILWSGDPAGKAAAEARATAALTESYESRNTALQDYAELTPNGNFSTLHLKALNGTVRFYIDPHSDMDLIVGPDSTQLNLEKDKPMNLQILEKTTATGETIIEAYVSTNPAATPEAIKADSAAYVTWDQAGEKEGPRQLVTLNGGINDNIYTETQAATAITEGTLTVRSLSQTRSAETMRAVQWDKLARDAVKENEGLFREATEEQRRAVSQTADALIASGLDYEDVAWGRLGADGQRMSDADLNTQITELYRTQTGGITPNTDLIYLVRQEVMVRTRPENTEIPLAWNQKALELTMGDAGQLYADYMKEDSTAYGDLPEGTEYFIYVSAEGDMKVLQSYSDAALDGVMWKPVRFDPENPEKTLSELGITSPTDAQKEQVRTMAQKIRDLDWKPTPFNTLQAETFSAAKTTWAGELLMQNATELYSAETAAALKDAYLNGRPLDPELEKAFVQNVKELLDSSKTGAYGKTMVGDVPFVAKNTYHVALLKQCLNLVLGQNHVANFEKPTRTSVDITASRKKVESVMSEEVSAAYRVIDVGTHIPTWTPEQTVEEDTSDVTGDVDETTQGTEGGAVAGSSSTSHSEGDHPNI